MLNRTNELDTAHTLSTLIRSMSEAAGETKEYPSVPRPIAG